MEADYCCTCITFTNMAIFFGVSLSLIEAYNPPPLPRIKAFEEASWKIIVPSGLQCSF